MTQFKCSFVLKLFNNLISFDTEYYLLLRLTVRTDGTYYVWTKESGIRDQKPTRFSWNM
jgi:hypothetical protein